MLPIRLVAPAANDGTYLASAYEQLHLGLIGFGVERTCGFTRTFFGPGFLPVRTGRHVVFGFAI